MYFMIVQRLYKCIWVNLSNNYRFHTYCYRSSLETIIPSMVSTPDTLLSDTANTRRAMQEL